ncbi:cell division control (Cdc15) [Pyrenophora seminiperda CCB06]|uniref:Cell division control (Cdc15) n=1 Tax=Pyrenophora seminiperda CCB06 TaxID=1302712 RepID=A0A3M7MAX6_9PLEO|nr:cell division control (Cdc15) [Pyrenophora seminiperda CCB06]
MSFANNFWGKDDAGVGPMLDRMHAAKVTNDELKNFYAARAAIEEEYSRKLLNLSRKQLGSCETGTLRLSCDVIRAEVESMGKSHQSIAHQMKTELEEPLAAFAGGMKERRKIVQNGIEKLLKLKMQQTATVNKARDRYEQDCLKIKGFLAQAHMVMGHEERKNKAKLEKTQINLTTTSADYEAAVKVLEETTGRWNRDWKAACDKFQDLEEERIDYTKSSLWNFANIASTVCVSDDASCEKMRLSLEDCDVEKDIFGFIKESGTGQEIPDPPKFINFCRGDAETSSQVSEDENYSVAQFARTLNPAYRASSPAPSTFSSHHDPKNPLARELGIPQNTPPISQDEINARPRPSTDRSRKSVDSFRQSVDKPRQSVDKSRQSVEKSRQSIDSFRQSVDKPRQPIESPPQQAERSRQYVDQHRQYADEPQQYMEEPQQYMEEPRQYVEPPQQYMEEPRQYVEPPEQYMEEPRQYVEPPQQHMEEPRQYVEPPRQQVEPPRQHVEQPRRSVEQMRQHIEQPRQHVQPLRQHVEPPQQQRIEPLRQYTEPSQQRIEPVRQYTEPPKQHVEPLRQQPEPRRQRIEPLRKQPEPQRQPVEPEPVQPIQPAQTTRAVQPDPRLVQAQQQARQQYQQSEVPHNDYPADGMTQFCRIGPPSDRSSIPSPVRPASRDSQSDYSNPTSFSSIEAPSPATPSKPVQQPVQQEMPQEMPQSPLAEPTPPEEGSVAKKRGFFNSPFARRKSKHEIEPPPLATSNRNTWTPPSRRNTQENVSPIRGTASPTKNAATPAKLNPTPAQLNTTPLQLNTTPAKLNTTPAKLNTSPTKLNASPTKLNATPSKFSVSPSKFSATPAKLNTSPTKSYASPAKTYIGRTRAIESAPPSPMPEPEAADPRANFQLNVGNNVFDVASPDEKKSEEQTDQQEELDPIAQALEELRGVTKQASVRQTVDDRKQASVRQTADRYHGLATPAPPATPAVGSKLAGSTPTPLSNVTLNAAKRGTPPPSYETPPMSRLGAPKPAHTSRAMQKTTQMYVNQKANMFNTTEPARAPSRSPTKQEAPQPASPAPARAVSPRPSPLTTQQAPPQNSYRTPQPSSPSTYQPAQRQTQSPSTYQPAQRQTQSPSTFQPAQRQQPSTTQPVQRPQSRAAQPSPRPQSVAQSAPKPAAQPVAQPTAQSVPRVQQQASRPASRQQQQPPQTTPLASFSRTASPNPYAPSNVGGRPRAQTATSTAQAYGTPVERNSYSSARGPSPSVNTTPRTASPLPPQQPPQSQQPPQPQQPQQPPQPAFAQSQSRPQSRAAPVSRTASPNPQFRQSNDRPPSSRGSDKTFAPSIAGSVRGDGSVYGGSQFGGSVRGRPPSARPQSSYMNSSGGGSELGFDAGSGSSVRAESRTRSKSLAEPKNYNSQGRLILNYSRAMYSYAAQIPEELGFQKGDILAVLRLQDDGWWEAEAVGKQGRPGLVPSNYLQPC